MEISDDLLFKLANEPMLGILDLCDAVEKIGDRLGDFEPADYDEMLEAYAVVSSMRTAGLLVLPPTLFSADSLDPLVTKASQLFELFRDLRNIAEERISIKKYEIAQQRFDSIFQKKFGYEFTQGDLDRINVLIGELRQRINDSEFFSDEHRRRLLMQLEKLQTELHKKVSDLARFYALLAEGGVVLKKFGEDAKPIVDRIRELAGIAWRAQARAEDLPSDSTLGGPAAELLPGLDTADD